MKEIPEHLRNIPDLHKNCQGYSLAHDHYTQTPNEIYDFWLPILKPAEYCVLSFLCRKTFGFHKAGDKVSLSQIIKGTGLSKQGILNSLFGMVAIGLIEKKQSISKNGGNAPNHYSIKVIREKTLAKEGVKSVDKVVAKSVDKASQVSRQTKETITKEKEYSLTGVCGVKSAKASFAPAKPVEKKLHRIGFDPKEECLTGLLDRDYERWGTAYPGIDLRKELAAILVWLIDNPSKAKRKKNFGQFIGKWLKASSDTAVSKQEWKDIRKAQTESKRREFEPKGSDSEYANRKFFKTAEDLRREKRESLQVGVAT